MGRAVKPRSRQQAAAIARAYRAKREPGAMLAEHIRTKLQGLGQHVDQYDPDFIIATIVEWLDKHRAVLTATGVESEASRPADVEIPTGAGYGSWSEGDPLGYDG
jgi:hypothetical protein